MKQTKAVCHICKSLLTDTDPITHCTTCNANLITPNEQIIYSERDCRLKIDNFDDGKGTLYLTNQRLLFIRVKDTLTVGSVIGQFCGGAIGGLIGGVVEGAVKGAFQGITDSRSEALPNNGMGFSFLFDEIESVEEGKFSVFERGIVINLKEYYPHKLSSARYSEWINAINFMIHDTPKSF